ncbi:B-cell receptor CD22-like isoform X2 [Megalobrama amblycephala]|uniref:B-cell receptor CD22-like isoform X2 n=1 Tax=Megalobrama amblycephala TaxID=75352 RepID=UPI00201428DD|nr:B-cell receptor CD22-like isoform X2 [Megalobrama amblycephala]
MFCLQTLQTFAEESYYDKVSSVKFGVVVKVRMALVLLLIFLLMNSGVFGQDWNVNYKDNSICAVKGSTVNMSCTYRYPQQYNLTETLWINKPIEIKSLKEYQEYKDRVEYIEDRQNKTAVLRLRNVTENDEKVYYFRLITATEGQRWFGQPGIQLNVSALQVQAPQQVLEKETVNLTCRTTCNLTDRFIWYKNGQALNFHSNILQLQSVRSDSGSYSCAVRGQEHLPSPAVSLSVMYSPRNTSVSISPSGEIVSGDSVTLNCSSDSNPPALNFSWFRGETFLGSGDTYSISNIKSEASGNYYCSARNEHGSQFSAALTVNVMYPPKSVSVSISPSGEIVSGDSVTLNCSSDSNPPALNFSWFKEDETSAVGSGQSFSISSFSSSFSGRFYCEAQNKYGSQRSASVSLTVKDVGRLVILYISIGVIRGAAVIIMLLLIWRSRRMKKRNDTMESQMNRSSPRHDRRKACDVELSEPVYENVSSVKFGVVVKVRMALVLLLIFLLMNSGVFGQDWNVNYKDNSICALKGSTVNISCTYRYPQQYNLTETLWIKKPDVDIKSLKEYQQYKDRVEYIEDRQNKTAVLRLHNVTEDDEKEYCFRLITATEGQQRIGEPGIQLKVSALQVQAPQQVLEKETVNLTCRTTCDLTDRFIWYKNGQALNFHSDILQLQSVRSDSGSYSCAVRGQEHLPSPAVSLSVMYSPRNTSVSISPSGEIVSGDSVTLICSSDSNPPALNFSWFKEDETSAVGSGQSFSISSFSSSFSGRFYCEAQNKYGSQRSASVSLTVKGVQRSASVSLTVKGVWNILYVIIVCATIAIIAVFGLLFLLILCIRNKRRNNDSKDSVQKKESTGKSSESGDGKDASIQDCRDKDTKEPEEDEIQYASITIQNPATEDKSTSQEKDLSVIYSSVMIQT